MNSNVEYGVNMAGERNPALYFYRNSGISWKLDGIWGHIFSPENRNLCDKRSGFRNLSKNLQNFRNPGFPKALFLLKIDCKLFYLILTSKLSFFFFLLSNSIFLDSPKNYFDSILSFLSSSDTPLSTSSVCLIPRKTRTSTKFFSDNFSTY